MPFTNRAHEMGVDQPGRRILRPSLGELRNKKAKAKQAPPEQTNAEAFYYLKQMNAKTPMVIIMTDGEEIRGWIEWYDRTCLKVNREGSPNLLISKRCIKYMYKQEEE